MSSGDRAFWGMGLCIFNVSRVLQRGMAVLPSVAHSAVLKWVWASHALQQPLWPAGTRGSRRRAGAVKLSFFP